jgi:hypothetical protein
MWRASSRKREARLCVHFLISHASIIKPKQILFFSWPGTNIQLKLNGSRLGNGDGPAVSEETALNISAIEDAEIIVFICPESLGNMSESKTGNPQMEAQLGRLRELRLGLLRLHKALLDAERVAYERVSGQVSGGELLQLVINHEQFAWLHSISELIVRIDELLDADEPATNADAESLFTQTRTLLKPSEEGTDFERKYYAALQHDPDIVLAHRAVTKILLR